MNMQVNLTAAAQTVSLDIQDDAIPGYAKNSRMYTSLSSFDYHNDRDVLSCSTLKPLLVSPAHFQANLLTPSCGSKAKDFGSLVHALVLEPRTVGKDFAVYPGQADGRAPEYKSFVAANPSRLVVDEPTFASGRRLAEKTLERRVMGRPFGDFIAEGSPEVSIYFEDPVTGVMLKIRPDLMHPEFTFDLKTTRHSTAHDFVRDGLSMGYDLQAFMYSMGRSLYDGTDTPKPFIFIAAESDQPHSVQVVTAGSSFLNNGWKKYQECLTVYKACMTAGLFPDAGGDITAEITPWETFSPNEDWRARLN